VDGSEGEASASDGGGDPCSGCGATPVTPFLGKRTGRRLFIRDAPLATRIGGSDWLRCSMCIAVCSTDDCHTARPVLRRIGAPPNRLPGCFCRRSAATAAVRSASSAPSECPTNSTRRKPSRLHKARVSPVWKRMLYGLSCWFVPGGGRGRDVSPAEHANFIWQSKQHGRHVSGEGPQCILTRLLIVACSWHRAAPHQMQVCQKQQRGSLCCVLAGRARGAMRMPLPRSRASARFLSLIPQPAKAADRGAQ
jgi:hypothetical protein